jgi:hypothetical protein
MSGSRAAAINAMCKQCIYDPYQRGNWRQQVEACTSKACPLYEFRPVSSVGDANTDTPSAEAA